MKSSLTSLKRVKSVIDNASGESVKQLFGEMGSDESMADGRLLVELVEFLVVKENRLNRDVRFFFLPRREAVAVKLPLALLALDVIVPCIFDK